MTDETPVTEETPKVEEETTAPSESEREAFDKFNASQTASETEEAPAVVSEQPVEEEKPSRAQSRIKELAHKVKETKEEVDYWKNLAQPNPQPTPQATDQMPQDGEYQEDGGYLTADQIADATYQRIQADKLAEKQEEAKIALQKDIKKVIKTHPDLEKDDDLAELVFNYAVTKGISLSSAADVIKGKIEAEAIKREQKLLAERGLKSGVASPQGKSVSSGEKAPVNLANMSEEEKRANWNEIINSL